MKHLLLAISLLAVAPEFAHATSAPQTPQTAPQTPQTAPQTPQTAPQTPQTAPQTPQTAPENTPQADKKVSYQEIDTESLKKIIDSKEKIVLLDARKKLKGGLLPGAKNLPFDADDKDFDKILGSLPKNSLIVVYCANIYCPLSKYLAERLVLKGFSNVYKYPDGIAGWLDKDYPLDPV